MASLDSGGELTPPREDSSSVRPSTPGPAQTPRTSPVHPPTPGHHPPASDVAQQPSAEATEGGAPTTTTRRMSARSRVAPQRGQPATLVPRTADDISAAAITPPQLDPKQQAEGSRRPYRTAKSKEPAVKAKETPVKPPAAKPPAAKSAKGKEPATKSGKSTESPGISPPVEEQDGAEGSGTSNRRRSLRVTIKRPGNRTSEQPETPLEGSASKTPEAGPPRSGVTAEETIAEGKEKEPKRPFPRKRSSQSGPSAPAVSPLAEASASGDTPSAAPAPAPLSTKPVVPAEPSTTAQDKFRAVLRDLASEDEDEEGEKPRRVIARQRPKKQTRSGRTSTSSFARVARDGANVDSEMADLDDLVGEDDEDEASGDDYQDTKGASSKASKKRKHAAPTSSSESEDEEDFEDDDDKPRKRSKNKGGVPVAKGASKTVLSAKAKPFVPRTPAGQSATSSVPATQNTAKKLMGSKAGVQGKASPFAGRPSGVGPPNRPRPSGSGASTPHAQGVPTPKPRPKPNVSAFDSLMGISTPAPPTPSAQSSKGDISATPKTESGDTAAASKGAAAAASKEASRPTERAVPTPAPQYPTRPSAIEMPVTQEQMDRKREVERKANNDEEDRFDLLAQSEIMFSFEEEMKADPLFQHLRGAFKASRFGGGLLAARDAVARAAKDAGAGEAAGVPAPAPPPVSSASTPVHAPATSAA